MNRLLIVCAGLLLASANVPAIAQVQRSGSDAGAARVMLQLQQVTADRDKALAEGEKLRKENEELKAQLKAAAGERDALRRRNVAAATAERTQKDADEAAAQQKLRDQVQELVTRYRETAQTLRDVETDRTARAQLVTQREQELKSCVDRNVKLYALNDELLDRIEDQGFWSAVAAREPFTRLKRTALENLADEYRDAARDQQIAPGTARP
jgi:hypothetical protein